MTLFAHIIIMAAYVLAAMAVAFGLPNTVPEVSQNVAYVFGGTVFVACALLHEVIYRRAERVDLMDDVHDLRQALADTIGQVHELTVDASRVRTVLKTAEERDKEQRELMAEMRVLQTLLAQFEQRTSKRKAGGPVPAPARTVKAPLADHGPNQEPPPHPIGHNRGIPTVRDGRLTEIEVQNILRHALQENRVDLYLQPIVSLPQRKVRFYEAYSRIRDDDGKMIVPDQYLHVAEESGLITTIDNLLLFRCVQLIRKVKRQRINVGFFCNISARTLNDDFFFSQFLDFMEQNAELADSLIFEFSQDDVANHTADTEVNLAKLAAMGFQFSMDQIGTLDLDYMDLARRHIKFVKIDADLMLRELGAGSSPITIADLKRDLTHTGVNLIAEKIENERSVADLVEYSVDFGQGFLFGEPRPAREPF